MWGGRVAVCFTTFGCSAASRRAVRLQAGRQAVRQAVGGGSGREKRGHCYALLRQLRPKHAQVLYQRLLPLRAQRWWADRQAGRASTAAGRTASPPPSDLHRIAGPAASPRGSAAHLCGVTSAAYSSRVQSEKWLSDTLCFCCCPSSCCPCCAFQVRTNAALSSYTWHRAAYSLAWRWRRPNLRSQQHAARGMHAQTRARGENAGRRPTVGVWVLWQRRCHSVAGRGARLWAKAS